MNKVRPPESSAANPPLGWEGFLGHLFRHEAGRLVSILTGIFGIGRLHLAEDVVQEALLRALRTWPYYGRPANPSAWLMQTAKRLAIDTLRREANFRSKEAAIVAQLEIDLAADDPKTADGEVEDAMLKLIFTCCHPVLPQEAQVALALKVVCGFGTAEIARAFLISETAVAKRLTRARQRLQQEQVAYAVPTGPELPVRLDAVLQVLYILFAEGHHASSGQNLVRQDLCAEAIRLGELLTQHPAGDTPASHALLALCYFHASRLSTRTDAAGNLLRLHEQDRQQWDGAAIQQGVKHLALSRQGPHLTSYHLEAAIAACHTLAPQAEATDWRRILDLYDRLLALTGSPVVALNRVVAYARVHGPEAALAELDGLQAKGQLENYHLVHGLLGDLAQQRGLPAQAREHFRRALDLCASEPERRFLSLRLEDCEEALAKINEKPLS